MSMIDSFLGSTIDRSRTVISLLAVIMLTGIIAYNSIPIESEPDVSVPVIIITIPHEGISPEDSERLLVRPMELELKTIEGADELHAYAGEGSATLVIEFDSSFEPGQAVLDVREAVDKARAKIPSSAEEPIINEISMADFPVITVSLGGVNVPNRVLYKLARKLKDDLEGISEVLDANIRGNREEVLEAVIDPAQLEAYGISNEELLAAVARNNRLIAAGSVDTGRGSFSVKIPSVIESAKDVLSIPLKATSEGVVALQDVVTLKRTFKDPKSHTRANGKPAVAIEVSKRVGTSVVDVNARIHELVEDARKDFPKNVEVSYIADQAPDTIERNGTLEGNISTAMFLVLTVVVAVGLRSGILVAMAIPFSFLFSFIVISSLGYSYNFMTMFGMLLGLGMLIDGAIVVVELAERKMSEGEMPREAYIYAIKRMFLPVVASVATTLAAFLPLMFWPGIIGDFMHFLPVTVFAVLVGSLLYALLFAPVIGVLISGQKQKIEGSNNQLVDEGRFDELRGAIYYYATALRFTTSHPFVVITITVLCLYGIVRWYGVASSGTMFFIDADPQFTGISISAKGNYSAEEVRDIVTDVENRVTGEGYIGSIYTRSGDSGSGFSFTGSAADQIGNMVIELSDRRTRDIGGREVEAAYRDAIKDVPGVRAEIIEMEQGPPVGKDIQLQLQAIDLDILIAETHRIKDHLESMDGLIAVDDTAPVPGIEWEVTVDRAKAAMLGAGVASVGAAVQLITNGILVGRYRPDDVDDEVDIRVRYPEEFRGITQLDQLRVSTREGQVPISSFVERKAMPKVSSIYRENGHRTMYVRANAGPGVLADDKVTEIKEWIQGAGIDPSIKVTYRGASEEQEKANEFIVFAFSLALMLMGILLVTQFNSFYQALLILSAVIMSTVGVLLGLIVTGYPFSAIMTGVGIVALAGIIVNNNIVLIDTYNYLHRENPSWSMQRVIVQTGCQRLRPVFLTTFTTGFGLLPMASGISIDLIGREVEVGGPVATFWVQLASAIVSGLTFATLLTLLVTPAMLMAPHAFRTLRDNFREKRQSAVLESN
jgi:multidrug efflux pump